MSDRFLATLASGVCVTAGGAIAARILNGLTIVVAARAIGLDAFGDFNVCRHSVGVFAVFAALGLSVSIARLVAHSSAISGKQERQIITAGLAVCSVLTIIAVSILYAVAPGLAADLGRGDLTWVIRSAGLLIVTGVPLGVVRGALQGQRRFGVVAFSAVLEGSIGLGAMIALASSAGAIGVFAALALGQSSALLMGLVRLRPDLRLSATVDALKAVGVMLASTAMPILFASMLHGPAMWLFYRQVSRGVEGSTAAGLLGAGDQVAVIVALLPEVVSRVALPLLSNNMHRLKNCVAMRAQSIILQVLIAIVVAIAVYTMRNFVPVLAGREFEPVVGLMSLFCLYGVIRSAVRAVMVDLMAQGRVWLMFLAGAIWAGVLLLANALLMSRYGVEGSVYAWIIASVFQGISVVLLCSYARRSGALNRHMEA